MSMPKLSAAGRGWKRTITMAKVTQSVVDGLVVNTETEIRFRGTLQPLNPRQIELKPEGQRSWEWIQLHVFDGRPLNDNDEVTYCGRRYKVMGVLDYSQSGYLEYHIIRDYQNGAACNP